MSNIIRLSPILENRGIGSIKFVEPKANHNHYIHARIRHDIRLIKQGLELHGYLFKKLNHREVWRIGRTNNLYLLSYQLDPLEWELFPHSENLSKILAWSLDVIQIADTRSSYPL